MSIFNSNNDIKTVPSAVAALGSVLQKRGSLKLSLLSASCLLLAMPYHQAMADCTTGASVVCTGNTGTTSGTGTNDALIGKGPNETTITSVTVEEGATVADPAVVISTGSGSDSTAVGVDDPVGTNSGRNLITINGAAHGGGQEVNGPYGASGNVVEFGNNTDLVVGQNGEIISEDNGGSPNNVEAVNPTGDNNRLINHGVIATDNKSTAIWFEGTHGQGVNIIDNYGEIRSGTNGDQNVIGSSVGSIDLINREGGQILGNVELVDGKQNNITLYNGSYLDGDLYGGGQKAVLNLTGDQGKDVLPDGSNSAVTGDVYGFGTVNKTGAGTWVMGSAETDMADFNYDPHTKTKADFQINVDDGTLVIAGNAGFKNETNKAVAVINQGGTLQLGNGAAEGWINEIQQNDGTLALDWSQDRTFDKVVTGSGGLHKMGDNTVTLTGDQGYTGVTEIDAGGTLQLGDGTTDGTINNGSGITDNGTLAVNNNNETTIHQVISGTGGLTQQGAGKTILTNVETYTGQTTISGGGLQLGDGVSSNNNGRLNGSSGIVLDHADFTINDTSQVQIAQQITGEGNLNVIGKGGARLIAHNNFTGDTNIDHSFLYLGDGQNASNDGSLTSDIAINGGENALLAVNNVNDTTFQQNISGDGYLTTNGPGKTIIAHDNSGYTGNVIIVGNSSMQLGDGAGHDGFLNNANSFGIGGTGLTVNNSGDTTLHGIWGSSDLVQAGSGTTSITGDGFTDAGGSATYSGAITIDKGTLQLGDGTTDGTLRADSNTGQQSTITVAEGANFAVNNTGDTTVSQSISGAGNFVQKGSGTTVLLGDKDYTGTTTISDGVLQLGDGTTNGTLSATSGIVDNAKLVVDNHPGSFHNQAETILHDITGTGSFETQSQTLLTGNNNTYSGETIIAEGGELDLGNVTYRAGGANGFITGTSNIVNNGKLRVDNNAKNETVLHDISGTGELQLIGGSHATLRGENSYSGETSIARGTRLQLGDETADGTLSQDSKIVNDGMLTVKNQGDTALHDITDDKGGVGTFEQAGSGKTVLTGDNTYHGETIISNGTLQIGDGTTDGLLSNTSDILDNSHFIVNNQGDTALHDINGTGTFEQAGTGTTTLTGDNGYQGTTTISDGVLQLGDGTTDGTISNSSAIIDNAKLVVNNQNDTTLHGISGSGAFEQAGTGTTTLTGENSYTGTTSIDKDRTLQLGDGKTDGTINNSSDVVDNGTLAVHNQNETKLQNISGTGSLEQDGTGKTILTGENTYAGTTTINQGTLQLGDGTTDGTLSGVGSGVAGSAGAGILNNGTLAVDNNGETALNNIHGNGAFEQDGKGTTILYGDNSYSGTTTIKDGVLQIGDGTNGGHITGTSSILNDGKLVFDSKDGNTVHDLTGTGALEVATGSVTMQGDNAYTGETVIDQGATLDLGGSAEAVGDGFISGTSNIVNNGSISVYNTADTKLHDISGTGSLETQGDAKVILTGDNSYSGSTDINYGGTIQLGDGTTDGTLDQTSQIKDYGTLVVANKGATTLHNVTNGPSPYAMPGSLQQIGSGTTTLIGDNDYKGETIISDGTLQLGDGTTDGTISKTSAITDDSHLVVNNQGDTALHDINGKGTFEQAGTGTTTLTGDNGYKGTTTISQGVLQLGDGTTNGTISNSSAIIDNAKLVVNNQNDTSLHDISGTGAFEQAGTGTTTLTGDNSYTGTTSIDENSTLQLGDGKTDGTINSSSSITDNGTLTVNNQGATTLHEVSGTGVLDQNGSGTTTLVGNNSYTGGTNINNGTLQLGDGTTDGTIASGSQLVDNSKMVVNNNADTTLDFRHGFINGAGDFEQKGPGKTTLIGTIGYAGTTTIDEGRVLQFGNGSTTDITWLGSTSKIVDNGTLIVNTNNAAIVKPAAPVFHDIEGTGGLTLDGGDTVSLKGDNSYTGVTQINHGTLLLGLNDNDNDGFISGTSAINIGSDGALAVANHGDTTLQHISGAGALNQKGTGTTTLLGENADYQGTVTIDQGVLQLGDDTTDGTINNSAAIIDNSHLTVNNQGETALKNISGSGDFEQKGAGTTTLTGDNSYQGVTTISDGALQLGDGTTDGTLSGTSGIVDNSHLTVNNQGDTALKNISGSGDFEQKGTGTTTLTGDNSYQGVTTISHGALQLGDGTTDGTLSGTSGIVDNSHLAVNNQGDTALKTISGSGDFEQKGTGTTTLTGDNSYQGVTTISHGALQLGDGTTDGTLSGTSGIVDNSHLTVNNQGDTALKNISGSGDFEQKGTGTTTLTGDNSYQGVTTISHGALQLGDGTTDGTLSGTSGIVDNSHLAVNNQGETALNGISGSGDFEQKGTGITTLTGENSLSGATTVSRGTLDVEGSLEQSNVTAKSGAILAGAGSVGDLTAEAGATVKPGSQAGTQIGNMTVKGDYHQESGSTYVVKVVPNDADGSSLTKAEQNQSDHVDVYGTATLDSGSILHVQKAGPGIYSIGTKYNVLTATGGVNGTYQPAGQLTAFYTLQATYDPNNVYLEIIQDRDFYTAAKTRNQIAASSALQSLAADNPVRNAVGSLDNDSEARQAFDALSGEIHASVRTALIEESYYTRDAAIDRLRAIDCGPAAGTTMKVHHIGEKNNKKDNGDEACEGSGPAAWMQAYGSWGSNSGNGNASRLHHSSGGFIMGVDTPIGESNWHAGAMIGYGFTGFDVSGRRSNGHSNNVTIGAYGGTHWGHLGLRLGASYTWNIMHMGRTADFANYSHRLNSDYNGGTAQAFADIGYRIDLFKRTTLEPFANVAYVNQETDSFTEHGDYNAALHGRNQDTGVTYSTFGVRMASQFNINKAILIPNLTIGYRHAFGELTPTAKQRFLSGGDAFTIAGVPLAKDTALVDVGLKAKITPNMTAGVSYVGQYGSSYKDSGLRGDFSWKF